jgi:hypothetical protein
MIVSFCLGAGSNFITSPDAWTGGDYVATVSQVNACDNVINDFQISDVCLVEDNEGQTRDPEFAYAGRDYFEELQLCQRYYQDIGAGWTGYEEATTTFSMSVPFNTVMRSTPALSIISSSISTRITNGALDRLITNCSIVVGASTASARGAWLYFSTSTGGNVAGRAIVDRAGASVARADAEL